MTRICRAPRGTRVVEGVPFGWWETTTFVGALRSAGFTAPLTVDGRINGRVFFAWMQQHLVPTLSPGDIVVMDNLSSHKVKGVREAIAAAGAEVRYLPPYSPDLAPHWTLRSNRHFPSSRNYFATEPKGRPTPSGISAVVSSITSQTRNAATTSNTADTATINSYPL